MTVADLIVYLDQLPGDPEETEVVLYVDDYQGDGEFIALEYILHDHDPDEAGFEQ